MGCGGAKAIPTNIDNLTKLTTKINQLIKEHPFYSTSYSSFREIITSCSNEDFQEHLLFNSYTDAKDLTLSKKRLIDSKVKALSKKMKLNVLHSSLIKDIVFFSSDKMSLIYQTAPSFSFYLNDIINTLYFFICDVNQDDNLKKKKSFISELFDVSKKENSINEYYSGKLSFMIYSLILFSSFSFMTIFVSIGVLSSLIEIKNKDIITLLANKQDAGGLRTIELEDIIKERLRQLKLGIIPNIITRKLLARTLQPLSRIIMENPNIEIVEILQYQKEKIIDNIMKFFNVEMFSEFFFSDKHKL